MNKIIQNNKDKNNSKIYSDLDYDINFKYEDYENHLVTNEIITNSQWFLKDKKEAYFINGLIRKLKPKNCLEIGVANGGSSIVILNALKDLNTLLESCLGSKFKHFCKN